MINDDMVSYSSWSSPGNQLRKPSGTTVKAKEITQSP